MGKGWEGIATSSRGSENNWLGTCEAHHVDFSPQEDRGGSAGKVGEGPGGEEGWLEVAHPVTSAVIAFETADSRDSSRSEHSLGVVKNRFHVDVEGFQIAVHLGQSAYRLDGTV
jgi:hypothetical protein